MRDEHGNITVFAAFFGMSMVMLLLIAVEFGCVYAVKSAYDNDLNVAREETLSAGFGMELKSSPDPGALLARRVTQSLRRNGYGGEISFWFYEATAEEIEHACPLIDEATNVRAMAYHVQLDKPYENVMAPRQLLDGVRISNGITASLAPYSLHRTYKPPGVAGRLWLYRTAAGSSTVSTQERPLGEMSPALAQAVQVALEKPTEIYRANQ